MLESIQAALTAMEERATKAEERAITMEEKATRAEERAIEVEKRAITAEAALSTIKQQIDGVTNRMDDMTHQLNEIAKAPAFSSPSLSYADVARTAPNNNSNPSNAEALLPMGTTPSTMTDTLYCTVDTSRVGEEDKHKAQLGAIRKAIEGEIRTTDDYATWRCAAVIRDGKNSDRIRIACRDEGELQRVKDAAQKTAIAGTRVLRDQLYPVKVDNANRTAVLDEEGNVLPGAAEVLGKENDVNIAKIAWLSRKDTGKAYGSMVIYVTKGSEAVRLLQEQFFHVAGESAYTRIFEYRVGPTQCYNCQVIGHKAYACIKAQICAKCAKEGHSHKECLEQIAKCTLCKGPHESFSKNCRVLHGTQTTQ
jgi:hypothetical protein